MANDLSNLAHVTIWQRLVDIFTTPSLTLFLLIGSAMLAISLIILMLTRWGNARPITKCVILSVIAHVLLLGYAYGTRLIFEVPAVQHSNVVNVHLIGHEVEGVESNHETPLDKPAADQLAAHVVQTETESLQQPELEVPFELEQVFNAEIDDPFGMQSELPPGLGMPQFELRSRNENREEPVVRLDDSPEVAESTFAPEKIDFQRLGAGENDVRMHEPSARNDQVPLDTPVEMADAEINPAILNQDSFPSVRDRVEQFESELMVPDSPYSLVDQLASSTGVDPQPVENHAEVKVKTDAAKLMQHARQARRLGDGKPMPAAYQLRSIDRRRALAVIRGGTAETENAVEASLQWLARIQQPDGSWNPRETSAGREDKVYGHDRGGCGANADMGITALATLAFLGAGHTHLEGEYQNNVQRALEFLVRHQAINGDLSGPAELFARMYCHSMSLLALSEALAMTGDHRLVQPVRSGVGYTVQAQNKSDGGWRYQPGDAGDMSQFGWKVMALHSANLGGVAVEQATLIRMKSFLDACRTGKYKGLASYRPNEGPSTTMTAEALVCNYFLGAPISDQALNEAKLRIIAELPTNARTNLYYWYYATLALSHFQDDAWQKWNASLQPTLLAQQIASGENSGSWPPDCLWAGYGGRVYSTAMATLCLEVYYRYLPDSDANSAWAANRSNPSIGPLTR